MRWLDCAWRLIAKFWALAFIFVGGGFLAAVLLPLATALARERCERAQILIRLSFRFYLWLLQALGVMELHLEHAERLRQPGQIIIANHPSLLDVVILMSLVPRAQCIVKHQLWDHWTLGVLMRRAEYIRNDLPAEALVEQCGQALTKGRSLIIFPEGTRTPLGHAPRFNRGFANIALLTKTPILPVTITCDPPHLYKEEAWWHVPARKPIFRVIAGSSMDTESYIIYGSRGLAARKLLRAVEQQYAHITGHGHSGA